MPAWLLVAVQLLCVAAIVTGAALIYVPAAFIAGGLLVGLVCESPALERRR